MRKILFLTLLLSIVACKSRKTGDASEKYQLENLATVISKGDLQKAFPDARIAEGVDLFEEGTVEMAYSVLYPETKDELLVLWKDKDRKKVYQIYCENDGRWTSKEGIKIGSTSYDDLLALNNGPIDVYGFGWDYSGAVDWKDGKLAKSNIRVFLEPVNAPPQSFYGDHILDSKLVEEIRNLDLRVRAIVYQGE
ncbi:hypothetical protein [Salinimicrobium soli]|uniref:hypothetical protein n=1 Tax=Salinimicrobium soli TaxID=1254399 RepID=UPI003AAE71CB